jgi:undecaprenyl diphosphate synthase
MNKHHQSPIWRGGAPVPRHVAIIMDGNGRWAESRGLPRSAGHHMGVEAVRRTVRAATELGVQYLTIFSFSSENWSRPAAEIDDLMGLMRRFIRRDLAELHQNGVRIAVIGERDRVDPELLALIDDAVALTSENTALNLVIAFNYGSRAEIARAARRLAERALEGAIKPEDITPDALAAALDTTACRTPICSSAPAESCASRISCFGNRRIPSSYSWKRIGPISDESCWSRRSTSSADAFAGLAGSWPSRPADGRAQKRKARADERARRGGRRRRRTPRLARASRR